MSMEGLFFDAKVAQVTRSANVQIDSLNDENAELQRRLGSRTEAYCSMRALVYAYQAALKKLDPDHPMCTDGDLLGRIGDAGISAFRIANTWDAPKEAGRSFSIPPRPGGEPLPLATVIEFNKHLTSRLEASEEEGKRLNQKVAELQARVNSLTKDLVDHVAQRAAFRQELSKCDQENPILTNVELRERISQAGRSAYALTDGCWESVSEAGGTFIGTQNVRRTPLGHK